MGLTFLCPPSGHTDMEIEFELEDSDIIVDFISDFRVQTNASDQTKVSWRLPNRKSALNVGVLCEEFSTESPADTTVFSWPDVRLLPR